MDLISKFYGESKDYFASRNCEHTAKEIAHQPDMWRGLVACLQDNKQNIADFMHKLGDLSQMRIVLTGAGSSGFVGRVVGGYISEAIGLSCEAIHTTDIVASPKNCFPSALKDKPTLLISFARSGNSPESVGAVQVARKLSNNLYELAIVCDGGSLLSNTTRESDKGMVLVMPEGTNDKGFAMTSSVSTMILAGFAVLSGYDIDTIASDIAILANSIEEKGPELANAAKTCAGWDSKRAWYLGCGPIVGLTQEGALKMMELTNGAVVAGYNNAPEFRHGPKTVMTPQTLTVHFVSPNAYTAQYDADLLKEIYSQKDGNKVVAIHDENSVYNADLAVKYSSAKYVKCGEIAVGIQGLVFMQLLSVYSSLALQVPTDNPSPSGLVNRVVQGVTVYNY